MMRSTRRPHLPVLVLAACLALGGCGDALVAPDAFLVAAETEAALRLSVDLPTLPRLIDSVLDSAGGEAVVGDRAALGQAHALWFDAAAMSDPGAARSLRRSAYALAAPILAAALDSAALAGAYRRLDAWIQTATAAVPEARFPWIRAALDNGGALLVRAQEAAARGDEVSAIAALLEAADRLAETTPDAVALRLIRRADDLLLARLAETGEDGDLDVRRAERLLRGAREALTRRDFALAIRRAYYAAQLLEQG